jgi:hypothetical protein
MAIAAVGPSLAPSCTPPILTRVEASFQHPRDSQHHAAAWVSASYSGSGLSLDGPHDQHAEVVRAKLADLRARLAPVRFVPRFP